jgi:hypothetical protein
VQQTPRDCEAYSHFYRIGPGGFHVRGRNDDSHLFWHGWICRSISFNSPVKEPLSHTRTQSGLAGWQWVFIIDGVITCPIAIVGYLYFPDTPEATKAPYITPSEKQLALARLPAKLEDSHNINPWSLAKRTFTSPAL